MRVVPLLNYKSAEKPVCHLRAPRAAQLTSAWFHALALCYGTNHSTGHALELNVPDSETYYFVAPNHH